MPTDHWSTLSRRSFAAGIAAAWGGSLIASRPTQAQSAFLADPAAKNGRDLRVVQMAPTELSIADELRAPNRILPLAGIGPNTGAFPGEEAQNRIDLTLFGHLAYHDKVAEVVNIGGYWTLEQQLQAGWRPDAPDFAAFAERLAGPDGVWLPIAALEPDAPTDYTYLTDTWFHVDGSTPVRVKLVPEPGLIRHYMGQDNAQTMGHSNRLHPDGGLVIELYFIDYAWEEYEWEGEVIAVQEQLSSGVTYAIQESLQINAMTCGKFGGNGYPDADWHSSYLLARYFPYYITTDSGMKSSNFLFPEAAVFLATGNDVLTGNFTETAIQVDLEGA